MALLNRLFQPIACTCGFHSMPDARIPPGPVVATCGHCGKAIYYYGISAAGMGVYPSLMLPNFPKVLGPISARPNAPTVLLR